MNLYLGNIYQIIWYIKNRKYKRNLFLEFLNKNLEKILD
ncbi:hypothetical protein [Chryseobacterium sp. G0162]